jgi:hypothetical protein
MKVFWPNKSHDLGTKKHIDRFSGIDDDRRFPDDRNSEEADDENDHAFQHTCMVSLSLSLFIPVVLE